MGYSLVGGVFMTPEWKLQAMDATRFRTQMLEGRK
jgi:hypothetical protein